MFMFGVPLMPTFQGPLCVVLTVPCTGSGVFVTITGAEPAAPAGCVLKRPNARAAIPRTKSKSKRANEYLHYGFRSFCKVRRPLRG